jgi:hypothetical protein
MIQDDLGIYRLQRNGTLFSFDRNDTVIDSRQLTGEEFKALSGCNMVVPGMPSPADHETEQCLLKRYTSTIPNSDVSVNSKRKSHLANCGTLFCLANFHCLEQDIYVPGCHYCVVYPGSEGSLNACTTVPPNPLPGWVGTGSQPVN